MFEQNVSKLEEYKKKLILFPRREGKPKKGEIADTKVAASLKDAKQNTNDKIFALPAVKKRVAATKITAAMKSFKAFETIKNNRFEKRNEGKRLKALADKEKEAK